MNIPNWLQRAAGSRMTTLVMAVPALGGNAAVVFQGDSTLLKIGTVAILLVIALFIGTEQMERERMRRRGTGASGTHPGAPTNRPAGSCPVRSSRGSPRSTTRRCPRHPGS